MLCGNNGEVAARAIEMVSIIKTGSIFVCRETPLRSLELSQNIHP